MTTATISTSGFGRIRTYALAGTLAFGMLFPIANRVVAEGSSNEPAAPSSTAVGGGFDIVVESPDDLIGRTAIVSSDGDGANLRAEPSLTADVIASLPDGTLVDLRVADTDTVYDTDGVTRWWPVSSDGTDGWISGEFLADSGTAVTDGTDASTDVPTDVDEAATETEPPATSETSDGAPADGVPAFVYEGEATADSTARVAGSGENVNVRAEPDASSDVVAKALDGEVIALRIAEVDTVLDTDGVTRWWPVTVEGEAGWISGFYLVASDHDVPTSSTTTTTPESTADGADDAAFQAGDLAIATTESGTGVNIRSSGTPESAEVGFVPEGATVEIVDGPVGFEGSEAGWYEITYDGATGFVDGDLLVLTAPPKPVATETPEPTATATATSTATATASPTRTPTAEATRAADNNAADVPESEGRNGVPGLIYPLDDFTRTQGFGCSNLGFYPFDPDFGCGVHDGVDLAASSGTPIHAAAAGTVLQAGWCDCGLGYYVEIDHGNDVHTIYGHMAGQPLVSVGQQVEQGETIGPVGSSGVSTGPHVHFLVRIDGTAVNPEDYLPNR